LLCGTRSKHDGNMAVLDLAPLFEPIQVSGLRLRNRFVLPAMQVAELVRCFAAGELDLVGVGRMQIANADFVAKLASGRLDALRLNRKAVDLGHLFGRLEPGLIEEGRKITAD